MSDAADMLRSLLDELEAVGRSPDAKKIRDAYDLLGWDRVTDDEVERVRRRLPAGASPLAGRPWSPLDSFGAWIRDVPSGTRLLGALNELAKSRDFDQVVAAVRAIFVDCLGYTAEDLEETRRLTSTGTIARLCRVADFRGFKVTVAQMVHPRFYGGTMVPVFQLHPDGLAFEWYPLREHVRLTFRSSAQDKLISRTFVGPSRTDPASENLVTWLGRLAPMAPGPSDSARSLTATAHAHLSVPAATIASRMTTAPMALDAIPPGVPWDGLAAYVSAAFLQKGAGTDSWHWGLNRAFRERFPIKLGDRPRIVFRGHEVGELINSESDALREGRSWIRAVTVLLSIEDPLVGAPIRIRCALPEFAAGGQLVLDGLRFRTVPFLSERGEPHIPNQGQAADLEDGEAFELQVAAAAEGQHLLDAALEAGKSNETDEDDEQDELEVDGRDAGDGPDRDAEAGGADPCSWLLVAVRRKLNALVRRLWQERGSETAAPLWLSTAVAALSGGDGLFSLFSAVWLRSVLEPVYGRRAPEDALHVLKSSAPTVAASLPPWACPDVSADLPLGMWVPVANARLSPAGSLAVPTRLSDGTRRLSTVAADAFAVNPRCASSVDEHFRGWTAPEIGCFESSSAGQLERAATFAAFAGPIEVQGTAAQALRVVARPGVDRRLRVFVSVTLPASEAVVLSRRIPAEGRAELVPTLRVQEGNRAHPGQVWLDVSPKAWEGGQLRYRPSPTRALLEDVFGDVRAGLPERPPEVWRVPPGVFGAVVHARVVPECRKGAVVAWVATVHVRPDATRQPAWAWLPGGQAVSLEWGRVEDAPFDENGQPFEALLEGVALDSHDDGLAFDSVGGELLDDVQVGRLTLRAAPAASPPHWPDPHLGCRLRDGEGMPHPGSVQALTALERLWWRARDPAGAALLDTEERDTTGGEPPSWVHLRCVLAAGTPAAQGEPTDKIALDLDESAANDQDDDDEESADLDEDRTLSPWRRGRLLSMMRTQPFGLQTSYRRGDPAPLEARCTCGALQGTDLLAEFCYAPNCGGTVRIQATSHQFEVWPRLPLPEPILHPWAFEAVAALLACSRDELCLALAAKGHRSVGASIAAALRLYDGPLVPSDLDSAWNQYLDEALADSVSNSSGDVGARAESGVTDRTVEVRRYRALQKLGQWLGHGSRISLWLESIPILPPALHPTGLPDRAPYVVESPIRAAYCAVKFAARRLTRFLRVPGCSATVLLFARHQLIMAVSGLYGNDEVRTVEGEPGSFAELALRLWPTTRPTGLRTQSPGLFAVAGTPCTAEEPGAIAIVSPSYLPLKLEDEGERELPVGFVRPTADMCRGIVSATKIAWFPPLPTIRSNPAEPAFWSERVAMARLCREGLVHLAAVMSTVANHVTGDAGPSAGRKALASLLAALESPGAAPSAFVAILGGRLPVRLPLAEEAAAARVERAASLAFPGHSASEGRRLLVIGLSGWWHVTPSRRDPTGWRFCWPGQPVPKTGSRAVPTWSSSAWFAWADFVALSSPLGPDLWRGERQPTLLMLRALCGFPVEHVPTPSVEFGSSRSAPEAPSAHTSAVTIPDDVAAAPPSAHAVDVSVSSVDEGVTVQVLRTSLAFWLQGGRP